MTPLEQLREDLAPLRTERARLRTKLEAEARAISPQTPEDEARDRRARIAGFRDEIDAMRKRELLRLRNIDHPRDLMPELRDHAPILLMPLRIETRWDQGADPALLIRVYPDDISVQSHDRALTAPELNAGRAFREAPETSEDPKILTRREIWRGMAAEFGLRRAAWIHAATDPAGPPPEETKEHLTIPAAWTLPDRLVFRFYNSLGLLDERVGLPIPNGLEMSFDLTKPDMGFQRQPQDIEFPPELAWQVNFDEAVKVGMAFRLPLAEINGARALTRLIVIGLRLSTDGPESAKLVESLIEDHRYTDGISILRQGTPTNITNEGDRPKPPNVDDFLTDLEERGSFRDGEPDQTPYAQEPDGVRLARALGISPESIRHVEGASNQDCVEAIAMKRALWAGTLGYYTQQMLSPFFEDALPGDPFHGERTIAAARFFFTNFVSGRGPLPAIRVGDQPYGVLPVSPTSLKRPNPTVQVWSSSFLTAFCNVLQEKIAILAPTWIGKSGEVKRAGAGVNADDRLLSVLAHQASAVGYRSVRLIGREYLSVYTAFKDKAKHDQSIAEFDKLLQKRFNDFQGQFAGLFPFKPRIFDLSFFGGVWNATLEGLKKFTRSGGMLLTGDIIDNLPFSESRTIGPDYPNYIRSIASSSLDEVLNGLSWQNPKGKTEPVSALLYMLLRHSYAYEHAYAAMRLHRHFRNVQWPVFREKELYNLFYRFDDTYWGFLREPMDWVLPGIGARRAPALELITDRFNLVGMGELWHTFFGDVQEQNEALEILARLPTARLERLLAEHIDLASYRLDAWVAALAYQRLLTSRAHGDALAAPQRTDVVRFQLTQPIPYAPDGLYLGAYGWIENLKPDAAGDPVRDLPDELRPREGRAVTRDPDNFGLTHAPSLDHAVTAALLRSGSVTQRDRSAFNIDLSSARVRNALWLIEGVRRGQLPAALLGYRFERILADTAPPLLQFLPQLREAFPMPKPQETAADKPLESMAPLDVVNGMLLVQSLRTDFAKRVSFASPNAQDMFGRAAAEVADVLDAAGDLMLAESVHQAARGNFERAGAVVTAAGEFTHVPAEFEVAETPRSGAALTHRVIFCLNSPDVDALPASPRARLQPELNRWLADLLPPLNTLAVRVVYSFTDGGVAGQSEHTVLVSDLRLEPIDLVYAIDSEESPELTSRIDALARADFEEAHPGIAPVRIRVNYFFVAGAGRKALGEILPLLDSLRRMLTLSRGAIRSDLIAPNQLHDKSEEEKAGIDRPEFVRRVFGVSADDPGLEDHNSLWLSFTDAVGQLADDPDNASIEDWKQRLMAASLFGLPEAVPALPADAANTLSSLRGQAERVLALMQGRIKDVTEKAKWVFPAVPEGEIVELTNQVVRILLGANFPLMPRIQPSAEIPAVFAVSPERIEQWFFGASQVREPARRLQDLRTLAAEFAEGLPPLELRQAPDGLPVWIADELPASNRIHDLMSVAIQPASVDFDSAQQFGALVVDEWHELLPQETETTGVAFHYDAPNSEPPQTLLLAVSDRRLEGDGWTWEDLVSCVEQALQLAKIRAVTPDQLRETPLDTILPATYSAESATAATIALSYMANVSASVANAMLEAYKLRP